MTTQLKNQSKEMGERLKNKDFAWLIRDLESQTHHLDRVEWLEKVIVLARAEWKKEMEEKLRLAYRSGQDSVTCMRVIHSGQAKPSCMCDDIPCTCKISKTDSLENEMVKRLLTPEIEETEEK